MKNKWWKILSVVLALALIAAPVNYALGQGGIFSLSGNSASENSAEDTSAAVVTEVSSAASSAASSESSAAASSEISSAPSAEIVSEASSVPASTEASAEAGSAQQTVAETDEPATHVDQEGEYSETTREETDTVTSFAGFSAKSYKVSRGTDKADIGLPDSATANIKKTITTTTRIYQVTDDPDATDGVTEFDIKNMTDAEKEQVPHHDEVTRSEDIGVKSFDIVWSSEDYNADKNGTYTFTAKVEDEDSSSYTFADGATKILDDGVSVKVGSGSVLSSLFSSLFSVGSVASASDDSVSADSASKNSASKNSASKNSASKNSASANTVSDDSVSEDTLSENAVSEDLLMDADSESVDATGATAGYISVDGNIIYLNGLAVELQACSNNSDYTKIWYSGANGGSGAYLDVANASKYAHDTDAFYLKNYIIVGGKQNEDAAGTNIKMTGGNVFEIITGDSGHDVNGNTVLDISGGTVGTVIGGCTNGNVTGDVSVTIGNAQITSLYCACYDSTGNNGNGVGGQVTVNVNNSTTISGGVYGGYRHSSVGSDMTINISDSTINGSVYVGNKVEDSSGGIYDVYTYGGKTSLTMTDTVVKAGVYNFDNLSDHGSDTDDNSYNRMIKDEYITLNNCTIADSVFLNSNTIPGSTYRTGNCVSATITINGGYINGGVNGIGFSCNDDGNHYSYCYGKLVLEGNPSIGTAATDYYINVDSFSDQISYKGAINGRSGYIYLHSNGYVNPGTQIVAVDSTNIDLDVVKAFTFNGSAGKEKLMLDYANNRIVVRNGSQMAVTAYKDGQAYSGLKNLTLKSTSGSTSLSLTEMGTTGVYGAYYASADNFEIYDGEIDTGKKIQASGTGDVTESLNYYTVNMQIGEKYGNSNWIKLDVSKTNSGVTTNTSSYTTASTTDALAVLEGCTVTVNAGTNASDKYLLSSFTDDGTNKTINSNTTLQQYTFNCTKAKTLVALFTLRKVELSIAPDTVSFPDASEGYTSLPSVQTVTITNSGTLDAQIVCPSTTSYSFPDAFTSGSYLKVPKNTAVSLKIQPKSGLTVGNYTEDLLLKTYSTTSSTTSVTLHTRFKVNKKLEVSISPNGTNNTITVVSGNNLTLTADTADTGTKPISLQWYKQNPATGDRTPISGATGSKYTIPANELSDGMKYYVSANDASTAASSNPITVRIEANSSTLTVTPGTLNLGKTISSDSPKSSAITITNTGNTPVNINKTVTGKMTGTSAAYTSTKNVSSCYKLLIQDSDVTILPGHSVNAMITATDETKKLEHSVLYDIYDADIVVSGNYAYGNTSGQAGSGKISVKYTVYSINQGLVTVAPSSIDFGSLTEGYSSTKAESLAKKMTVTYKGLDTKKLILPTSPYFVIKNDDGSSNVTVSQNKPATLTAYPNTGVKGRSAVYPFSVSVSQGWILDDGTGTSSVTMSTGFDMTMKVNDPMSVSMNAENTVSLAGSGEDEFYINSGEGVTLDAELTGGTAPYTYSWYDNGTLLKADKNQTDLGDMYIESPVLGIHKYTVTVSDDSGTYVTSDTKTVTVVKPAVTVKPAALTFTGMSEGYTKIPDAQTITIANSAKAPITVDIADSMNEFEVVSANENGYEISANSSITLQIRPKKGMSAGNNKDTINVVQYGYSTTLTTFTATAVISAAPDVTLPDIKVLNGNSGKFIASVTGGIAPYTYSWSEAVSTNALSGNTTNQLTVQPTADTSYILTVTDSSGTQIVKTATAYLYTVKLAVSPGRLNFGSSVYGYTTAPDMQSLKITNSGTGTCTIKVPDALDSYTLTGISAATDIEAGKTVIIRVRPNTGLETGSKNATLKLETEEGISAAVPLIFSVVANSEILKISPSSPDFGSVTEGYKSAPASKTITVTNAGNAAITVKKPTATKYTIAGFDGDKTVAKGASFTFTIAPNKGLSSGDQKETITLTTGSGKSATFTPTFTVVKAPEITITGVMKVEPGLSTTLTANVKGGTSPYTYSWSTGATTDAITVKPSEDTEYTVKVTDAAGVTSSARAKVTVATGLAVKIDGVSIINAGDTATLTAVASDGSTPYTYKWSSGSTGSSIEVKPTEKTTYTVTVTDSLGATATDSATVKVSEHTEKTEPTYTIGADSDTLDFGSAIEGYKVSDHAKSVTITNNGNSEVTLKAPTSSYYTFEGIDAGGLQLAPGASVTVKVVPVGFMDAGDYSEQLVFTTSQGTQTVVNAAFTVAAAAKAVALSNDTIFQTKGYDYGSGSVAIQVENPEGTDLIGVSKTADFIDATLTDEEKADVAGGAKAVVNVTTKILTTSSVPQDDKALAENMINQKKASDPDYDLLTYLDISVQKKVGSTDWQDVHTLSQPVALQMDMPSAMKTLGKKIYLLRMHDGVCAQIAQWSPSDNAFIFRSQLFSTYAITCIPVNNTQNTEQTKKTTNYMFYLWLLLVIAVFAAFEIFVWPGHHRKKDEMLFIGSGAAIFIIIFAVLASSLIVSVTAAIELVLIAATIMGNLLAAKGNG